MSFALFDDRSALTLRPFTFLRPVARIRVGTLTIAEKWERYLRDDAAFITGSWLSEQFTTPGRVSLYINGALCPNPALIDAITALKSGQRLIAGDVLLALMTDGEPFPDDASGFEAIDWPAAVNRLVYPEDIFKLNAAELRADFTLLTAGRTSARIGATNTVLGDNFFAEEGVSAECSTFNTLIGPVYLAAHAEVWEGCHIRGSFSLGERSQVKMGAKIYSGTTVGPDCRVGGEINNSVIFANSSKGHEGYLGNSVLGEWCNIGAGTDNSNMKNNYSTVRIWDYATRNYRDTGLQFCGLFMGDHAKCGIGTMFNTGTVAGIGANIFGGGYQDKFIPDFSWGTAGATYDPEKFLETVRAVYARRNHTLSAAEERVFRHLLSPQPITNNQ